MDSRSGGICDSPPGGTAVLVPHGLPARQVKPPAKEDDDALAAALTHYARWSGLTRLAPPSCAPGAGHGGGEEWTCQDWTHSSPRGVAICAKSKGNTAKAKTDTICRHHEVQPRKGGLGTPLQMTW